MEEKIVRRNFYLTDQTLQHILHSELDTPFFHFADKELKENLELTQRV